MKQINLYLVYIISCCIINCLAENDVKTTELSDSTEDKDQAPRSPPAVSNGEVEE